MLPRCVQVHKPDGSERAGLLRSRTKYPVISFHVGRFAKPSGTEWHSVLRVLGNLCTGTYFPKLYMRIAGRRLGVGCFLRRAGTRNPNTRTTRQAMAALRPANRSPPRRVRPCRIPFCLSLRSLKLAAESLEPQSEKAIMIRNAPIKRLEHGGLTIEGYSRAAVQTYWRVPELKLGFDLGAQPWDFMGTPTWFVTHTHLDHIAACPSTWPGGG